MYLFCFDQEFIIPPGLFGAFQNQETSTRVFRVDCLEDPIVVLLSDVFKKKMFCPKGWEIYSSWLICFKGFETTVWNYQLIFHVGIIVCFMMLYPKHHLRLPPRVSKLLCLMPFCKSLSYGILCDKWQEEKLAVWETWRDESGMRAKPFLISESEKWTVS